MKIKHIILFVLALSFLSFKSVRNFQVGEEYQYKIKFGILNLGSANVSVDNKIHHVNGVPVYKVSVSGKTQGIADLYRVRNSYVSYIDTTTFLPHKFEYSARENNYKRDQLLTFDHRKDIVTKTEKGEKSTYKVPTNVHDVISGYYSLRHIDFSKYSVGQIYSAPLFFDDEHYFFKVRYGGKGTIKTSLGKINVIKINPVLPNNKLFKGEDAIRVWVSDDENRVPMKIEADFSFGTIVMEIKKVKRNLFPFSFS